MQSHETHRRYSRSWNSLFNMFTYNCFQEFYDEWPIKLGEVEPYKGPKTPDGRVSANVFLSDMCAWYRLPKPVGRKEECWPEKPWILVL